MQQVIRVTATPLGDELHQPRPLHHHWISPSSSYIDVIIGSLGLKSPAGVALH